jgi:hypothetical protein
MEEAYLTLINRTNAEFVDLLSNLILDNREAIAALSSSNDISSFIKTKLNLTSKSQTKATGLTAAAPVAPRRSKSTSQNPPQLKSLADYIAWYEESNPLPICGYLSNRGSNADKVCAAILTEEEWAKTDRSHHYKYRCKRCYTGAKPKAGTLEKKMAELIGPNVKNRSSPGHNIIKGGGEKVVKNSLDLDTDDDDDNAEESMKVFKILGVSDHFFSKEPKFPGLIITENEDNESHCVGRLLNSNGKPMIFLDSKGDTIFKKESDLPNNWLENLSLDFTDAEKKFLMKKEIGFVKPKKKPLSRVEDSDSDTD